MKLSDLVTLKNALGDTVDSSKVVAALDDLIFNLTCIKHTECGKYQNDLDALINAYTQLKDVVRDPERTLPSTISHINDDIASITKDYFARGYRIVEDHIATNRTDVQGERNLRKLPISDRTKEKILTRIFLYADWHYPGLEIGPGDGEWTEHLVGCDPLYLVDQHQEFIDSTKSKFTPEYQNRLRTYLVGHPAEYDGADTDISFLPDGQFGFVFSWNVFNYFPLEHIHRYLEHCYRILKPGGVMLFSYNNGENPACVKFVEQGWMSYMPKSLLLSLIERLGFELIQAFDEDDFIHWVEIRKPGVLKTVKAHQAMGEIITK